MASLVTLRHLVGEGFGALIGFGVLGWVVWCGDAGPGLRVAGCVFEPEMSISTAWFSIMCATCQCVHYRQPVLRQSHHRATQNGGQVSQPSTRGPRVGELVGCNNALNVDALSISVYCTNQPVHIIAC